MAKGTHAMALVAAVLMVGTAQATSLTGICGFPTDELGNWKIGWYNTHGPDGGKNGYVTVGDVNGSFHNSGNGASTQISLDLTAPGTYTIYAFFDGDEMTAGREFWGVNLFFGNDTTNPGISAFGRAQWNGDSTPDFFANGGTTLDVAGENDVLGANRLTHSIGNWSVELTAFRTMADVYTLDRVDNFKLGSSGRNDHIAMMELTVVPEPATLAALGLGVLGLRRRRR